MQTAGSMTAGQCKRLATCTPKIVYRDFVSAFPAREVMKQRMDARVIKRSVNIVMLEAYCTRYQFRISRGVES